MSLLPQGPAAKQPPQRPQPVLLVSRPGPEHGPILEDAAKSFEYFKVRYPRASDVEENKRLLKEKYSQAKALGERVNQARNTITYLKKTIEQLRREIAMEGLNRRQRGEGKENGKKEDEEDERPEEEEEDDEEAAVRQEIEREKVIYQESFQNLRELKGEIEGIQRILEKGRIRMQAEFDEWYARVLDTSSHSSSSTSSTTGGDIITRTTAAPSPCSSPFLAQRKLPTSSSYHAEDRYRPPVPETTTPSRPTSTASPSLASTYAASCSDSSSDRERKQEIEIPGSNSNNSSAEAKEGGGRYRGNSTAATAARSYTGNKEADDDIAAFYRAKEELLRRTLSQQQHQQAPPAAAGPSPSNTTSGYQQHRK